MTSSKSVRKGVSIDRSSASQQHTTTISGNNTDATVSNQHFALAIATAQRNVVFICYIILVFKMYSCLRYLSISLTQLVAAK